MGTTQSRFIDGMVRGNLQNVKDLWKGASVRELDPNQDLNHSLNREIKNTIFHYACYHALTTIVRDLLMAGGGSYTSVRIKNAAGQTPVHCLLSNHTAAQERLNILKELLQYRGGEDGPVNLNEKDNEENTMLHLAASNGLKECSLFLINRGLGRFLDQENKPGNTPAAEAESNGYRELAAEMEGFIVFVEETANVTNRTNFFLDEIKAENKAYETHSGMRLQDIRNKKDQMVVAVSSFLYGNDISPEKLFNAECLLQAYQWNTASLQQAWLTNSQQACFKAGITLDCKRSGSGYKCLTCGEGNEPEASPAERRQPLTDPLEAEISNSLQKSPKNLGQILREFRVKGHNPGKIMKAFNKAQAWVMSSSAETKQQPPTDPLEAEIAASLKKSPKNLGQILTQFRAKGHNPGKIMKAYNKAQAWVMSSSTEPELLDDKPKINLIQMNACGHTFCSTCWKRYLEVKIKDGQVQSIICPAFKCNHRVPSSIIDYPLVDKNKAKRYMKFELRDFVKENDDLQWCPAPGCDVAVCRKIGTDGKAIVGNTADCGDGHFFCFECKGEPHEPCSCDEWTKWQEECKTVSQKLGGADSKQDAASMATMLWLQSNTKQCPKCKSNIQKNEGCNHMTCRSCRHEFCWICMATWSTHGSKTGGFYKCNVFKGAGPTDNRGESALAKKKLEDSKRFIHFIERFKAHNDSKKLEQKMVNSAKTRIEEMQKATVKNVDTIFVQIAFRELYWNRIVLCASYVKKYYSKNAANHLSKSLMVRSERKNAFLPGNFDDLQASLETATEALSGAIARKRWKSTRARVVQLTHAAQQARNQFLNATLQRKKKSEVKKQERKASLKTDRTSFECSRCTYLNKNGGSECKLCGAKREAKKKPRNAAQKPSKSSTPSTSAVDYSKQITLLMSMGFDDVSKINKALIASGGDVEAAVQRLV
uniref:RBR-type E3 ubiquitin transferase n=1 Tax=Amorphochlora amoebiformis TaxID=1561963 RepID=A0A7S0DJJ9_9EUKA|mmetsp:Transcript_27500/g.43647  ORF Transcript_27500/g.43647 Transcript_27500/m.43647 type:complete len:935 (+) Transcript_27500:47-2851(+)